MLKYPDKTRTEDEDRAKLLGEGLPKITGS